MKSTCETHAHQLCHRDPSSSEQFSLGSSCNRKVSEPLENLLELPFSELSVGSTRSNNSYVHLHKNLVIF